MVIGKCPSWREAAGNARPKQLALQPLADGVLAIENRIVTPSQPAGLVIRDQILDDPAAFFFLVGKVAGADRKRRFALGTQLLVEERAIAEQQQPGGLEYLLRAAAVLVENDWLDLVVLAKAVEDDRLSAGPRKNRLLVVTHHEEIAVRPG